MMADFNGLLACCCAAFPPHIFPTLRRSPTTATVFKWVLFYSDDIFTCHLSASLWFNSSKQSLQGVWRWQHTERREWQKSVTVS